MLFVQRPIGSVSMLPSAREIRGCPWEFFGSILATLSLLAKSRTQARLKQHSQTRVVLLPCPAVNVDYCTHGDVYNWNLTGAGREYDPFGAMMGCCFHARLASTRSWT